MLPIHFSRIIQLCIVCTIETTAQRLIFESSGDFEETITYVSFKVQYKYVNTTIFSSIIPFEKFLSKKFKVDLSLTSAGSSIGPCSLYLLQSCCGDWFLSVLRPWKFQASLKESRLCWISGRKIRCSAKRWISLSGFSVPFNEVKIW